jgi:hypothetical protein
MIEDIVQAFAQTFSPQLRRILLKAMALAGCCFSASGQPP